MNEEKARHRDSVVNAGIIRVGISSYIRRIQKNNENNSHDGDEYCKRRKNVDISYKEYIDVICWNV